jgi:2-isopropylmalate synthase
MVKHERPSIHFRHHAARRRTVAGLQHDGAEKLRMARKLVELGVDILEAGFPIASEGDFEAVDAVSREFPVGAAWRRWRAAARWTWNAPPSRWNMPPAAHPHLHRHQPDSPEVQVEEIPAAGSGGSRCRGGTGPPHVDDVEFSAEDGARTEPEFLEKISKAVVAAGAGTVNIPDTVGYSTPKEYGALIGQIARALGDCAIVSVHCHDDLGLAVANSLAAIEAGARQVECTINGIGERAGNCSLEEIVMILKTRSDSYPYHTGIHTEHLYSASELLSSLITFGPQPNKAIVGRNAFAHEAGIHQDGYLKEKTTYEIIDPHSVGVPEGKLVLGKHSGRHALTSAAKELGYELTAKSSTRCTTASRRWPTIARKASWTKRSWR